MRGPQPTLDDTSHSADERVGHLGLGLYFCKRAAEVQGGGIDVRQSAEWPTSFVIRLPAP